MEANKHVWIRHHCLRSVRRCKCSGSFIHWLLAPPFSGVWPSHRRLGLTGLGREGVIFQSKTAPPPSWKLGWCEVHPINERKEDETLSGRLEALISSHEKSHTFTHSLFVCLGPLRSSLLFRLPTLHQKRTRVWFEFPEEIPLGYEIIMQMLSENAKIKIFYRGTWF